MAYLPPSQSTKTTSHNPRSTVGTITEIYDYSDCFTPAGTIPSCPNCGREVSTQTVDQIVSQTFDEIETEWRATSSG